jgi:hypothetical protein
MVGMDSRTEHCYARGYEIRIELRRNRRTANFYVKDISAKALIRRAAIEQPSMGHFQNPGPVEGVALPCSVKTHEIDASTCGTSCHTRAEPGSQPWSMSYVGICSVYFV